MPVIYSARWVLPICSATIEDGGVAVDGKRIVAVDRAADLIQQFPEAPITDFGPAAILPGLVNAHSHLELTVMRGFLEREENNFPAWLRKLTIARLAMTPEDLVISATCGAIEAARNGITCLGDSSSAATQVMQALNALGLRAIVYQESFGPDPRLAEENVAKLREQILAMRKIESDLVRTGVSPHAPYTVSAPQLELISRLALDQKLPLMMHAAESIAEQQLMREGAGPFAAGLKQRDIEWRAPGISTIAYLARHRVLETKPLLAHCINVDDADLELIRQSGAGIAHCPRSNAKLGHGRARFAQFISRGIKVGLGSDSVASNNTCDILEEARFATLLARLSGGDPTVVREGAYLAGDPTVREGAFPHYALPDGRATAPISATQALFAATLGGARALRLDDQIGALAEGLQADLAVLDLSSAHQQPVRDPANALIFSSSGRNVLMTMAAGKEVYRKDKVNAVDENEALTRLETIRTKLDSLING